MPKIVDHDERRAYIARVSAEIIAEQGLEQATLREIAARSGVSKGIVEHYFANKDDVIAAALDWVNTRYLRREQRTTAGKRGLEAVAARLRCALPLTADSLREWKIRLRFWSLAAFDLDVRGPQSERLAATRERFEADLREAIGLGEVTGIDPVAEADRLIHLVAGVSCTALLDPSYYNRRYIRSVIDDAVAELRHRGSPARPRAAAAR